MGAQVLQPTFTGGELSPSLYARVDLARYGTSLRTAKNFIVRPYGGVVNRTGFQFIGEAKSSATRVRLLPFEYSSDVAYVIELGNLYARFIYRGEYVVDAGVPVEVVTPWTWEEVQELSFTQSADVMYLSHPSHQPREIRRLTVSSFDIRELANKNGPFAPINADESIKIASSKAEGPTTLTSNADIFDEGMVGSLVYLEEKDLRDLRPWEPGWRDPGLGTLARSDGKTYRCSSIPGGGPSWYQTGSTRPIHDSGRAFDGPRDIRDTGTDTYAVGVEWEYLHSGFGIVLITGYTNSKTVTGFVTSRIPDSIVGGAPAADNTWNLVGDGSNTVFTITGAVSTSNLDYTVTIDGVPVQPDPYYTPPGGIGGGSQPGGCVSVEMLVIDREKGVIRAGDVALDDWLLRGDGTYGRVARSDPALVAGVRLVDEGLAQLDCSTTAPIQSHQSFRLAPDMQGHMTPRWRTVDGALNPVADARVMDVVRLGEIEVQHITLDPGSDSEFDRVFLASSDGVSWWAHHNIKQLEP